jgi:hypothetical protein
MIDAVTTLLNLAAGIGVLLAVCAGGLLFAELVDMLAENSAWFANNRNDIFWVIVVFVLLWSAQSIGADVTAWAGANL